MNIFIQGCQKTGPFKYHTVTVLLPSALIKGKRLSFIHKQGANFCQRVAISIQNQY